MSGKRVRLLVVLGSVTEPGRLRRALDEAVERTVGADWLDAELVDLAEHRLDPVGGAVAAAGEDDAAALVEAVAAADAVVFATPVYRASMTGTLKNFLDAVPPAALASKPTGIVAMGAQDHHFLGAERHLRDVLAFFGALVAPVPVYLSSADFEDGGPSEAAAAALDELIGGAATIALALPPSWRLGPTPHAANFARPAERPAERARAV